MNKTAIGCIGLFAWSLWGVLAVSCEQRDTLDGADLSVLNKPEQGIRKYKPIAYSAETESIKSSNPIFSKVLGVISDPIFGRVKASFSAQLTLPKPDLEFGENPVLDSVVFNAPLIAGGKADEKNPYRNDFNIIPQPDGGFKSFTIKAYEITDSMKTVAEVTYSNHRYDLSDSPIGQAKYTPTQDSIEIAEGGAKKKIEPAIRISLADNSDAVHKAYLEHFQRTFLNADPIHFVSRAIFRSYFKGIYLTTEDADGSLVSFNGNAAELVFYFHDKDAASRVFRFPVGPSASQVGIYENNIRPGSELAKRIKTPDEQRGEPVCYIAGLGGPKAVVRLFSDAAFKALKGEKWVVNGARLIVRAARTKTTPLPPVLALFNHRTGDPIPFGVALLNPADNTYTFRIATYVNQLLYEGKPDDLLDLVAAELIQTPSGGVISQNTPLQAELDGNSGEQPIVFEISYTAIVR